MTGRPNDDDSDPALYAGAVAAAHAASRAAKDKAPTSAEYGAAKAATIASEIMREYAVPAELLVGLADALHRECLAEASAATAGLAIGTKNLATVASALDELRRRKVG